MYLKYKTSQLLSFIVDLMHVDEKISIQSRQEFQRFCLVALSKSYRFTVSSFPSYSLHLEMRARYVWRTVGRKEGAGLGAFESGFSSTLVLGIESSFPHSLNGWPHSEFLRCSCINLDSRSGISVFGQH